MLRKVFKALFLILFFLILFDTLRDNLGIINIRSYLENSIICSDILVLNSYYQMANFELVRSVLFHSEKYNNYKQRRVQSRVI